MTNNDPDILASIADMNERADELFESWVNGNLSHVRHALDEYTSQRQAIALAAMIAERMDADTRHHFARHLLNHAVE